MYWPMNFNLVQDCKRFSRKYELPYCGQFPTPLVIADDTKFIYFMQGLHLFLLVQLREFKAVFSPAEFQFITNDPAIMINLCTYLGFGCRPDVLTRQKGLSQPNQRLITAFLETNNYFDETTPLPEHVSGSTTRKMAARAFNFYVKGFLPEFSEAQFQGRVTRGILDLMKEVAPLTRGMQFQLPIHPEIMPTLKLAIREDGETLQSLLSKRVSARSSTLVTQTGSNG